MNIGDVWLALRADGARFQAEAVKEAQKAGDAAGSTLGSRMGKAAGVAFRGGMAVLSAGAAIATKGLLELDSTMAQFTADTGLAGEAADAAKKSILAMSGRNLQPMKEIGAVLGKVHTDLGLTGDAAEDTAEKFLHFARVTGRDASEEVGAFDDILDAWGLTADKSGGIMDQLVKSHQTFGGSIADDEAALKALAPAMKALNFGIDDSIGLLNLFKSKGLDAATSQRAFNTAVKNLPPGTKLEDVLKKIQAIEDPSQRAAAAIEVFGSKGGVALANALGPGIGSLDDFTISTEDASGAMEEGRDAIDGTFGAQAQLLLKGFTTKLVELGAGFGPVLTGLAALASLGGALGFDKVLGKAFGKLAGSALVKGAARNAGLVIGAIFSGAMFVGDKLAGALGTAFNALPGSGLVKKGIGGAGKLLGSTLGKLAAAGFAAVMVFEVFETYNRIKAELGEQLKTLGAAAEAQLITGTDAALATQKAALEKGIADLNSVWDFGLFTGDARAKLETELAATQAEIERRAAGIGPAVGGALGDGSGAVGAGADAMFAPAVGAFLALGYSLDQAKELVGSDAQVIAGEVVGAFEVMVPSITDGAEAWQKYRDDVAAAQQKAITDQLDFTSKALSDLQGFQSGVETALSGVYSAENDATITKNRIIILEAQLTASRKEQQEKGAKITAAERADYQNTRLAIEGELEQQKLHLALIGDDTHRVTALNALLTAKDLKANLLSENDNIRLASEVQRDKILGYLRDIATQGGPAAQQAAAIVAQWLNPNNSLSPLAAVDTYGQNLGSDFAGGIRSKEAEIAGQLAFLTGTVTTALTGIPATKYGKDLVKEFAAGISSQQYRVERAVGAMTQGIAGFLEFGSPTKEGPFSRGGGPEGWGRLGATLFTRGFGAIDPGPVIRRFADAAAKALAIKVPGPGMPAIAMAGAGVLGRSAIPSLPLQAMGGLAGTPGGSVTNVNVQVPGLLRAETPSDVVRSLRHLNVYGTFGEERK